MRLLRRSLPGDFDKRRKKLESLAQLLTIQAARRRSLEICGDPAHGVNIAICPRETADAPDAGTLAAVRANLDPLTAVERKLDDVAIGRHSQPSLLVRLRP